ncbi:MAG: hydrolase [Phycisphaerae bacterium]|nr:hydrolase [Phycisphaerae bacterium]
MVDRGPKRLSRAESVLLVVDLQEKLLPKIVGGEAVVAASCRLIRAVEILGVPVLVTEQYPRGIGTTTPAVREAVGARWKPPVEKTTFSCCGVEAFGEALRAIGRDQVLVVGIEAHVCVQQTVLDLLALGFSPFVCADAVGSRGEMDCRVALERMRDAGAVITTTEAVLFELSVRADTNDFKQILELIKG